MEEQVIAIYAGNNGYLDEIPVPAVPRWLALGLADVFSGEINFNSGLQPGDSFRLVVERYQRDGALAGYGAILAAEFQNDGRRLRAIRFAPPLTISKAHLREGVDIFASVLADFSS